MSSNQRIALTFSLSKSVLDIVTADGEFCQSTLGNNRFAVKNPLARVRKLQVWANWIEDREYVESKHIGKWTKSASVWLRDVCRSSVFANAISTGTGKIRDEERIDFVVDAGYPVGKLSKTGRKTRFALFVLNRAPLHLKQRAASYHGYPISYHEFLKF